MLLRRNRSLYSRVHHRLTIGPALPEDTAEYIAYRLSKVGCRRDLFSSDAISMIHESSNGLLRDIDRLGTFCLKRAARRNLKLADRELVGNLLEEEEHRRLG